MTSIIHKYLNQHFVFEDGKITSKKGGSRGIEPFTYIYFNDTLSKIIQELCLVFGMTKKQLKYYIKGWVRKQNRGFNFEEYWNPNPKFGFPMIRRVMAKTFQIAMDMARVETLREPRAVIEWSHFVGHRQGLNQVIEHYANQPVDLGNYGQVVIDPIQNFPLSQEQSQIRHRRQEIIEGFRHAFNGNYIPF